MQPGWEHVDLLHSKISVQSHRIKDQMIATQLPVRDSIWDFWHLCYGENISVIVQLEPSPVSLSVIYTNWDQHKYWTSKSYTLQVLFYPSADGGQVATNRYEIERLSTEDRGAFHRIDMIISPSGDPVCWSDFYEFFWWLQNLRGETNSWYSNSCRAPHPTSFCWVWRIHRIPIHLQTATSPYTKLSSRRRRLPLTLDCSSPACKFI